MKRALFLYNQHSGQQVQHTKIARMFEEGGYSVVCQELDFSRNQLCGDEDFDIVIVAGGDGSVNRVVNLIKSEGINAPLGIIPTGTANDFAYALGMAHEQLSAAQQIIDGVVDCVDCGRVNGDKYFVNVFSFGLFTTTSQRTPSRMKRAWGKLAYIMMGVKELWRIHDMSIDISTDTDSFSTNALMTFVLNGSTAGGFQLGRNGDIRDGEFDCIVLNNRNFVSSLVASIRYLLGQSPSAIKQFRAKRIDITNSENEPTDADGERGAEFPLNIECLHRELKVIIPNIESICERGA